VWSEVCSCSVLFVLGCFTLVSSPLDSVFSFVSINNYILNKILQRCEVGPSPTTQLLQKMNWGEGLQWLYRTARAGEGLGTEACLVVSVHLV
jgi:hypothetical protein